MPKKLANELGQWTLNEDSDESGPETVGLRTANEHDVTRDVDAENQQPHPSRTTRGTVPPPLSSIISFLDGF